MIRSICGVMIRIVIVDHTLCRARQQRVERQARAPIKQHVTRLEPRDCGLVETKQLAQFALRQPQLSPNCPNVDHQRVICAYE